MKVFFFLFLFPFQLFSQSVLPENKDLAGMWTGSLYNDTTQKYISYELAINDNDGKMNGYSHTIYLIDGVKNIGVKEVKIKIKKDLVTVEDGKLIDNDYTEPPAKGVRTFIELIYSETDSTQSLRGSWKTNRTKEYNSVTGTIHLERKKNIWQTLLIPKLEQLGLVGRLSFIPKQDHTQSSIASVDKKGKTSSAKDSDKGLLSGEKLISKSEPEKIVPDTTITDPELVVRIYVDKNKKSATSAGSQKDPSLSAIISNEKLPATENKKTLEGNQANEKKTIAKNESSEGSIDPVINSQQSNKIAAADANENKSLNKETIPQRDDRSSIKNEEAKATQKIIAAEKDPKSISQKQLINSQTGNKQVAQVSNDAINNGDNKSSVKKETPIAPQKIPASEIDSKTGAVTKKSIPATEKKLTVLADNEKEKVASPVTANSETKILDKKEDLISKRATGEVELLKKIGDKKSSSEITKANNTIAKNEEVKTSTTVTPILPTKSLSVNETDRKASNDIPTNAASDLSKRVIQTIRTVEITQDSLVLSLYDNGTVDGDTVSVLINGKVVMPKVGLLAKAYNKTIHITPEMGDSINVIMYAENLGSFAPNTGLLIVRDGDINYEIRFSGDLKTNSAIILKRKKIKHE